MLIHASQEFVSNSKVKRMKSQWWKENEMRWDVIWISSPNMGNGVYCVLERLDPNIKSNTEFQLTFVHLFILFFFLYFLLSRLFVTIDCGSHWSHLKLILNNWAKLPTILFTIWPSILFVFLQCFSRSLSISNFQENNLSHHCPLFASISFPPYTSLFLFRFSWKSISVALTSRFRIWKSLISIAFTTKKSI